MMRSSMWVATLVAVIACDGSRSKSAEHQVRTTEAFAPAAVHAPVDPLEGMAHFILQRTVEQETKKDVTCWTSFRQLDWFIAEKPYSEFATLAKIRAMKDLVRAVWARASLAALEQTGGARAKLTLDVGQIKAAAAAVPAPVIAVGNSFRNDLSVQNYNDYQKTAEHWRLVLAVIQDEIYRPSEPALVPISEAGLSELSNVATSVAILLLKRSGELAAASKRDIIDGPDVQTAYRDLSERLELPHLKRGEVVLSEAEVRSRLMPLTQSLIEGKERALHAFNKGAGDIISDLNRVSRMPLTSEAVAQIVLDVKSTADFVTAGHEPMRADAFLPPRNLAASTPQVRDYIDETYVQNALEELFPQRTETDGDSVVRFEPHPGTFPSGAPKAYEIRLLDHEMNGVRDSAVHWMIMDRAFKQRAYAMDPFAAEYLSELLSVAVTLQIRRGEILAKASGKDRIDATVAQQIDDPDYVMVPAGEPAVATWSAEQNRKKRAVLASYRTPLFSDVTASAGLATRRYTDAEFAPEGSLDAASFNIQTVMGGGTAVGDLDSDGYPDLFVAGEKLGRLYMNRGAESAGRFRDATEAWGIPAGLDDAHGAVFYDLEGDGDLDLLIVRAQHPALLLRHESGGRFVDAAAELGMRTGRGAEAASVFDADGDGDLDVYVGYYGSDAHNGGHDDRPNLPSLDGRNGTPNQLWSLNADGHYTETAELAGLSDVGWTLAMSTFDYDRDGDLDLYLANDFGANVLYQNLGGGRFIDVAEQTGTADRGSGMNVSFTDIDADGFLDVYVSNIDMFSKRIKVIFPRDESTINIDQSLARAFQYINGNKFYVNPGDPAGRARFTAAETAHFEPGDRGWGWGAPFFDYDNDGDDDMYLANGWIDGSYAANQHHQMFIQEAGVFYLAPGNSPEAFASNARSVAAVDVDRDGDCDLLVNNFRQPPVLLRNQTPHRNHWLQVRLLDGGKNSRAIGATAVASFGGRRVLRQVTGGLGYLSQDDEVLSFGLGAARFADVTIRWPDGNTQKLTHLPADRIHTVHRTELAAQ